jgi:hypothetical protein
MAQGVLPFKYEAEKNRRGMTALAELPTYLDLASVCGLSIDRHMGVRRGGRGWSDADTLLRRRPGERAHQRAARSRTRRDVDRRRSPSSDGRSDSRGQPAATRGERIDAVVGDGGALPARIGATVARRTATSGSSTGP